MPNDNYANEPNQSRSEDIIQSILDNTEYDEEARSRIEYLLIELKNAIEGGGGGGGVTSYAPLTEKPKIDNHTLQAGNNTSSDLGLQTKLAFDSAPTENSTNPVTSGGVYTALDSKANSSDVYNKSAVDDALTAKADKSTTYTKSEIDTSLGSKQNVIDSSHKLSADLVDDTNATNKFATVEELEQIQTNKNNILSDNIISTSFTWSNGYVSTGGYIFSSTQSYFSQPFTLHAGEKIVVRTKNKNICIIGTTTEDSVAVRDNISVLRTTSSIDQEETYDYTATEDIKVVICVLASNHVAYVANHNTDLLLGSYATVAIKQNEDNISTEQAKTVGMSEGGSNYITVGGRRVYVDSNPPTGARTGDLWMGG